MSEKKRIIWVDEYKGFLLLCVILSHENFPCILVKYAANMYMAGFFFISGFLYNHDDKRTLKQYFQSKIKTLLIPYVIFSAIGFILNPKMIRPPYTIDHLLYLLKSDFWDFVGGFGSVSVGTLWFLFTLFEISVFFSYLYSAVLSKQKLRFFPSLILGLLSGALGFLFYYYNVYTPLNLGVALSALMWYILGFVSKPILSNIYPLWIELCVFVVSALLFVYSCTFVQPVINFIHNGLWPDPVDYFIMSFSGICTVLFAVRLLSRVRDVLKIGKSLIFISNNAVCFLVIHWWLLMFMSAIRFIFHLSWNVYVVTIIVFCASTIMSLVFNRYAPWLVGKK